MAQSRPTANLEKLSLKILSYYPDAEISLVRRAYDFAQIAHEGQKRMSGEPYLVHPLEVAMILAELHLDLASIIAGLLHDTVEDTPATLQGVETHFGGNIAALVDGVTKISRMAFRTTEERQAENFRKMIVAMAQDIRVILVKLADRLNNMRTLEHLSLIKQRAIAQETLDIYAPMANRLGLRMIKVELEDLCFQILNPGDYHLLQNQLDARLHGDETITEHFTSLLAEKLAEYNITAEVELRRKHLYSIYRNLKKHQTGAQPIHDLVAFRVVVDTITECYKALGVIHLAFKPIPGHFKDYVAMPKANYYQSLHTTVISPRGERIAIQLCTQEMNRIAERGITANWRFKEGKFDVLGNLRWIERLIEWNKDLPNSRDFLRKVKFDLFAEDLFVFTPQGEIKALCSGATPVDFAYSIHSDLGHTCVAAKINGHLASLKQQLRSGDTIEILTDVDQKPRAEWLNFVRSSRAKALIKLYLRLNPANPGADAFKQGQTLLMQPPSLAPSSAGPSSEAHPPRHLLVSPEALPAKLESGDAAVPWLTPRQVVWAHLSRCCSPSRGDAIGAFITRRRGITVHRAQCPNYMRGSSHAPEQEDAESVKPPHRLSSLSWDDLREDLSKNPTVHLRVQTQDRPGILSLASRIIALHRANITSAQVSTDAGGMALCLFELRLMDSAPLAPIVTALEQEPGILRVEQC